LDSSTTELATFLELVLKQTSFKMLINSCGILQKKTRFEKHVPDRGSRIQLRGGFLERRDGLLHPAKDYPGIRRGIKQSLKRRSKKLDRFKNKKIPYIGTCLIKSHVL
jgi:hypothetical protein